MATFFATGFATYQSFGNTNPCKNRNRSEAYQNFTQCLIRNVRQLGTMMLWDDKLQCHIQQLSISMAVREIAYSMAPTQGLNV